MIAIKHFRQLVRDALDPRPGDSPALPKLYSVAAEELLVITCAQESLGGTYLRQNDAQGWPLGVARGIYQMEPATYRDLFQNYLRHAPLVLDWLGSPGDLIRLTYDLVYATKIARLNYYRVKEALPQDLEGQFRYYKKYWNTELGAATLPEIRRNYTAFSGVSV